MRFHFSPIQKKKSIRMRVELLTKQHIQLNAENPFLIVFFSLMMTTNEKIDFIHHMKMLYFFRRHDSSFNSMLMK